MTVEEVFVEHWVVVAQVLCQARETGGRDLFQGGLVSLMAHSPTVQDATILRIHDYYHKN